MSLGLKLLRHCKEYVVSSLWYHHVLGALHRLEAHKGDLHGKHSADTVEGAIGNVYAMGKPASGHQN